MSSIGMRARFGYGLGALGISIVYQTLGALLIFFFSHVLAIPPAKAGLIVFISSLWDGLVDPLIAWAASRTQTARGQYRPWLIFGSIPCGLFFFVIFAVPTLSPGGTFAYLLVASLLFRTAFQGCYLPFTALISRMTSDANERARLAGWKGWFTSLGQVVVFFGGLSLIVWAGGGNDRRGFLWMSIIFGVVIAFALMAAGLWTREEVRGSGDPLEMADTTQFGPAFRAMGRNRAFLRMLAASFCFGTAYALFLNLALFLFEYRLGGKGNARWALSGVAGAGLIAAPLWSLVAIRYGKKVVWVCGSVLAAAGMTALFLLDPSSIPVVVAMFGLIGLGTQPLVIIQFAALADAIDYGEWKNGNRVNAFSFGTLTFANKAAIGVGGGLSGWSLAWSGISATGVPGAHSVDLLRAWMMLAPAAIFVVSAAVMIGFEATTAVQREALQAIRARQSAGPRAPESPL